MDDFSQLRDLQLHQVLNFEISNLPNREHRVSIKKDYMDTPVIMIDAIEIDDNSAIKPYNTDFLFDGALISSTPVEYKYYDGSAWQTVGTTPREQDCPIVLFYTNDIDRANALLTVETEPFALQDEVGGKMKVLACREKQKGRIGMLWNTDYLYDSATVSDNGTVSFSGLTSVVRGLLEKTRGKWYWEIDIVFGSVPIIGVASPSIPPNRSFWTLSSKQGIGYLSTGTLINTDNTRPAYGLSYGSGSTIGVALDMENNTLAFSRNGVFEKTIQIDTWDFSSGAVPIVTEGSSRGTSSIFPRFSKEDFKYGPPDDGYLPYSSYYGEPKFLLLRDSPSSSAISLVGDKAIFIDKFAPEDFSTYGMNFIDFLDFSLLDCVNRSPSPLGQGALFTQKIPEDSVFLEVRGVAPGFLDLSEGIDNDRYTYTAPNGAVVTSSAPSYLNRDYYKTSNLFNGKTSASDADFYNYWLTESSVPGQTLTFDFSGVDSMRSIKRIGVAPRARLDTYSNYSIQSSKDGDHYFEILPLVDNANSSFGEIKSHDLDIHHQHVRFVLFGVGRWGVSLSEIRFFTEDDGQRFLFSKDSSLYTIRDGQAQLLPQSELSQDAFLSHGLTLLDLNRLTKDQRRIFSGSDLHLYTDDINREEIIFSLQLGKPGNIVSENKKLIVAAKKQLEA